MAQFGWAYVNCNDSNLGADMGIRYVSGSNVTASATFIYDIANNKVTLDGDIEINGTVTASSFIVDETEVDTVLDILSDRNVELGSQTWNRRYRDYMEKIKTGSVHEVAAVLRDLFLLSVDKDLSYGERKMLDTEKLFLRYLLVTMPLSTNVRIASEKSSV